MLTIKGYDKDLLSGVIYGWDLSGAWEEDGFYIFVFEQRIGDSKPVTCRIERTLSNGLVGKAYKCELFQIFSNWNCTYMLQPKHIRNSVLLYELVESTLENYKDSIV